MSCLPPVVFVVHILHQYEAITTSFNIHDKVRSVITDNAANMLKAITLLDLPPDDDEKDDEDIEEDEFQPVQVPEISYKTLKTEHHTCFAHTVQLIVVDGLKQAEHINRVLGKISKLVSHVRHSTIACDLLEKEVCLQAANATRWNSQLTMINSLLRVSPSAMDKLDYHEKLSVYETNITKELVEILTPFQWATDMVQGQNKVTASVVMPVIRGLQMGMEELSIQYCLPPKWC